MACSSNSWIVDMEKMLEHTKPSEEMARWKKTSIYRVPKWIRELTNREAYRPWLVSLGPFHHGVPDLLPMEEHKRRAVLHLVKRSGKSLEKFVAAIEEVVDTLQDAYQGPDNKCIDKGRFVEMMVTDGCFLLEVMRMRAFMIESKVDDDYAPNDPVFSYQSLSYLYGSIRADMLLIENQLPLLVLEKLVAARDGIDPGALRINDDVRKFLAIEDLFRNVAIQDFPGMGDLGLHLHPLDIFHSSICGSRQQHDEVRYLEQEVIPTATELNEAGVLFQKSYTSRVNDVSFGGNGVLRIPERLVDEATEKELLNLKLFEQLHMRVGSHVTNYLTFMHKLIGSEKDVQLLRSKRILRSSWIVSDKEVADLFNNLAKGAIPYQTREFHPVLREVRVHCTKRRNMCRVRLNRWRAQFQRTYLSNPWVFTSLVAAIILLVATVMQTIYTVVPFYTKSNS